MHDLLHIETNIYSYITYMNKIGSMVSNNVQRSIHCCDLCTILTEDINNRKNRMWVYRNSLFNFSKNLKLFQNKKSIINIARKWEVQPLNMRM